MRGEAVKMEQITEAELAEQKRKEMIEEEFGLKVLDNKSALNTRNLWKKAVPNSSEGFLDYYYESRIKKSLVFALEDGEVYSMLHLAPYFAAIRRNPPLPGARRLPCMADVVRIDANLISMAATQEEYRKKGSMKKLICGALEYQRRKNVPLCIANTDNQEFFEQFGFHYIYNQPQYELNLEMITIEMLKRAADGENVPLNQQNVILTAVDNDRLLSLAHFVNANLCRYYGLFVIRSAVYYEHLLDELKSDGGNLYQIVENGTIQGYFAYAQNEDCKIREAVFEKESDVERYFQKSNANKPAAMARIVNLPEMLKHISSNGKVTIAIQMQDPVIAENNGLFIWYLDEKGSRMERVDESKGGEEPSMRPEVTTTIGAFTAFLFEYEKLKQNLKFDSIYLSGPAWINEKY